MSATAVTLSSIYSGLKLGHQRVFGGFCFGRVARRKLLILGAAGGDRTHAPWLRRPIRVPRATAVSTVKSITYRRHKSEK